MSEHPVLIRHRGFGLAWLLLCTVFVLHVWDEAAHDFLDYYNATVLTLYGHFSWFPRMDMTLREWLTGLLIAIMVCLALTPFASLRHRPLLRGGTRGFFQLSENDHRSLFIPQLKQQCFKQRPAPFAG
jgi:hypothetical protein